MGLFDHFDDHAKRVLAFSQDEAVRFSHNYIGAEHLVVGLLRDQEAIPARALAALGLDLSQARAGLERIIGRGDSATPPQELTLSPRAKKVIELAVDEARKLGHAVVRPEHLLLAILREGGSVGAVIIQAQGLTLEQVRTEVVTLMPEGPNPA